MSSKVSPAPRNDDTDGPSSTSSTVKPPTGEKKKPKDLMDVYVLLECGTFKKKTSTIRDAGRNHRVKEDELAGQHLKVPSNAIGDGSFSIRLYDDDYLSGDDLIGSYTGNLLEILKGENFAPSVWRRVSQTAVLFRLKLKWGEHECLAGAVDVMVSKSSDGSISVQFQRFTALRDVGAVTDLRDFIDMKPIYWSIAALVTYYVVGVLFYALYPSALRGNTTSTVVEYECVDGQLLKTSFTVNDVLPSDNMRASCDQSLNNESWSDCSGFADALYFTTATLTTVGYGDMSPKHADAAGLLFASLFALVGVAFIALGLGIVAGFVMDRQNALEERIREAGGPADKSPELKKCEKNCRCCFFDTTRSVLKAIIALSLTLAIGMLFYYVELVVGQGIDPENLSSDGVSESMFIKLLYYATITSTTIGYGDEAPVTIGGRLFGSLYMLFSISLFGYALSSLADIPLNRRRRKLESQVTSQYGSSLSPVELTNIVRGANPNAVDDDDIGECSKAEFVVAMLVKLNKLKPDQVNMIEEQFNRLDVDRSGTLTIADVTEEVEPPLDSSDDDE